MGVNGWKELLKKYIGSLCLTGLEIKKKNKIAFLGPVKKSQSQSLKVWTKKSKLIVNKYCD